MSGAQLPLQTHPASYWEQRARRFASQGEGLAAVCSYGMPQFYNRMIQLTQRRALRPWLRVPAGTRVLDVGCGVGRWSRWLATRGALVHGIDLSPTMISIARQRAQAAGLAARCHFAVQDLVRLQMPERFDLVLAVTVLQHILDPLELRSAVERMTACLAPGGRMLLLEAAPLRGIERCDSSVFKARERRAYLALFEACGLKLRAVAGVDPAPFKTWLLPHLRSLGKPARIAAIAATSALSLPIDVLFGRRAIQSSWHALFVLEHAGQVRHGS